MHKHDLRKEIKNASLEDVAIAIAEELYPYVDDCLDIDLLEVVILETLEDLNDN